MMIDICLKFYLPLSQPLPLNLKVKVTDLELGNFCKLNGFIFYDFKYLLESSCIKCDCLCMSVAVIFQTLLERVGIRGGECVLGMTIMVHLFAS